MKLIRLAALLALVSCSPAPVVVDGVGRRYSHPAIPPGPCVLALTASDCPVARLYRPKLDRLAEAYRGRVAFAIAQVNFAETPEPGAYHDRDGALCALLGARRTTEAFLFDRDGILRYRGAVDDQYGVGTQRDAPTANWLVDAIEAVLAGRVPAVLSTEAPGCAIEREPRPAPSPEVTYHRDVEPIFQKRCQSCHRPGEIGPFALLRYEQARAAARRIKEVVQARRMPPWHADPKHGAWANDRRLSDAEVGTIVRWVRDGCPQGDPAHAPRPVAWPEGWQIGVPDAVYAIPREVDVPAEGTIPYRYIEVKTDLKEDKWVQAVEVRAGARENVHHILIFVQYPRKHAAKQQPIDGGLFYGYFAVMVPGDGPTVYPPGMGKFLPAGSTLVFQIHYTASGKPAKDRSQIGFIFAKEPPKHEVVTRGIINLDLRIPPGAANHKEQATFIAPYDLTLLGFLPHLHVRGKAFRYVAIDPKTREEEILLDVPRYDFNWQTIYRPAEPKLVKKGTRIRAIAWFDNSEDNPANPDPKAEVRYGEQTWEEMLNGYIDFIRAP
jgi:mono/diheme cytochrome c family protein